MLFHSRTQIEKGKLREKNGKESFKMFLLQRSVNIRLKETGSSILYLNLVQSSLFHPWKETNVFADI